MYVDESGIHKELVRERGRAARGVKVKDVKRGKKFHRTNVVAGQHKDASGKTVFVAPLCYQQTMNSELFEDWFRKSLVKQIAKGSTIIMDRASFHRKKKLTNLARRHGMKLQLLPAYSPDLNPIETSWANMKQELIDTIPLFGTVEKGIYAYLGKT